MTKDLERDPLMHMLAGLPIPRPNAARDRRITARCHAELARRHRTCPERERFERLERSDRLATVALAVLLCGYAVLAVLQAVRLIVVM